MALGHTVKKLEELLFDWLIYGAVAAWATASFGAMQGSLVTFAIMAPVSAVVCFAYLKFYDWSKQDWFGFEVAKELRDSIDGEGFWKRLLRRVLRLGTIPAYIAMSVWFDPFMTMVYLRKGSAQYNGLSRNERLLFLGSVLISNGYWTLRWTAIVWLAYSLWEAVP